ncbi:hypothetical protein ISS07_05300 [Candidatus Woesearchaeota archaeon]|nr:hypothetical protein [Candidatus Woesearchaeota archaeon]
MISKNHRRKILPHIISTLLLLLLLPFIVLLDIFVEIYHRLGFRLCNIPIVKRKAYIKIDRHKLKYLSFFGKLACAYCGYANGFAGYITEIAARTERYWCAIQHKKTPGFHEPPHHKKFLKYDDKKAYEKKYS